MEISSLIQQHYESIFRFAYRLSGAAHDAEDITQQTFLDAQRKLDTLRDESRVRAWLFMIARNIYRLKMRKRGSHSEVAIEAVNEPVITAEPELLDTDHLQAALASLSEEFRSVLVLYYFKELNYREIAEQLEVPVGTVMSRLSRGKKQLRERVSPDDF